MVVSGVPARNADRHAGEVANMALDLVTAAKVFVIPHVDEPLRIRIGIHSGKRGGPRNH